MRNEASLVERSGILRSNQNMLLLSESFSKNTLTWNYHEQFWQFTWGYKWKLQIRPTVYCFLSFHGFFFFLHTFLSNEDKHWKSIMYFHCGCSVPKSCPTLWDPINCSMPGFSVLHYLSEFTQIHVYCVNDTIPSSHPRSPLITHTNMFAALRDSICIMSLTLADN